MSFTEVPMRSDIRYPISVTPRRAAGRTLTLLLLVGAVALAGCNDFLNTAPKGELTTSNFFQDSAQAVQATNATYGMLRDWEVHVFSWIGMTDIASDDATKGSTPGDAGAGFLGDLDDLTWDAGNLAFHDTWQGYYEAMYRANVAIQNIPGVAMDSTLKMRLIGENEFLRAYYYFFLVRAYGGVPLITEPLLPPQFTQPRATADQVYAQIEQDLQDAIAVLPEKSQYSAEDMGRATKGAAQALLSDVYLYEKDYANALTYAQDVINSGQYSLLPSYSEIFTDAGENSSGSIFEAEAVALDQGGGGSQYPQVQGVRGTPNIGWGFNDPSPDLETSYEPGDPRLESTILYPWEMIPDGSGRVVYFNPSMPNNRYNQKAFVSPDTPLGSGNGGTNIRLIRYAQVLLTAAEAADQTGDNATAQQYLNDVRARARDGHTMTLGFSPETLAPSIEHDVLGLPAATSQVFVRYVNPGTAPYAAGLRSFAAHCSDGACAAATLPPIAVATLDIIETVDGAAVNTLDD